MNPIPQRYNKERHDYGTTQEERLKPLLEAIVGESLTKTAKFYDVIDFSSQSYILELKSRSTKYHPADFPEWLLPSCKGEEASKHPNKKFIIAYYWETTDEIYILEYDETLFKTFRRAIPSWHKEQQEHYYISSQEFSLVEFVEAV